jgi:hypothetical protein
VNFRGEKRSNATHASTTDPEARLAKRSGGKEAKLCHGASVLLENRSGICVDAVVHDPAEEARMAGPLVQATRDRLDLDEGGTVGADKGYAVPHVPIETRPKDPMRDGAAARLRAFLRQRTAGYAMSRLFRKRV